MRKILLTLCLSAFLFTACSPSADVPAPKTPVTKPTASAQSTDSKSEATPSAEWTDDDRDVLTDYSRAVSITLSDEGVTADGDGVSVTGSVVTITNSGDYVIGGSLSNGQLRVEADGLVRIALNGVLIHGESAVPFVVKSADKVILTLADGTQNTLSDSTACVYEDEAEQEPSAALFSKTDLTINGNGMLNVRAAFNDGIVSRDGLKIAGGDIRVSAVDDAIMGRDYVVIGDGTLTLNAGGDGIKSTNDQDATVGFVTVENGSVTVYSENDGIQAQSVLTVTGGTLNVTSGGGSQNGEAHQDDFMRPHYGYNQTTKETTDTTESTKALKAGVQLNISDGMLQLDAADDAIHSNGKILVSGGNVNAASGDDGVHADSELRIAGGTLHITKSYEGIEAPSIIVDDGELSIVSSDDGFNASSGTTSANRNPMANDGSVFIVNGGVVRVDAQGDGLDSNGSIVMTGGSIYVNGPQNGGNGTLDFASSFDIQGGTLVAVGSLGMAQTPTSDSQNSINWNGCAIAVGDQLTVTASDGTVVAEITATRASQWAYVSTPDLKAGETYTVSDGSSEETLTLEKGVNTLGTAIGGMGGGRPGGFERPDSGEFTPHEGFERPEDFGGGRPSNGRRPESGISI